jgi:hypothetical protein
MARRDWAHDRHCDREGTACGALRCAAGHHGKVVAVQVVEEAPATGEQEGEGSWRRGSAWPVIFQGPLLRAVLGVVCDGIPPRYVLVGAP